MWPSIQMTVASWIHVAIETAGRTYHALRRAFIPLVLTGGYDMALLSNNQWVHLYWPASFKTVDCILALYNAKSHTITSPTPIPVGSKPQRPKRCAWLSFTPDPRNCLTEFFQGLTIGVDLNLSPETLLLLAYNQTGVLDNTGPWTVQTRSGECETLDIHLPSTTHVS